MNASFAPQHDIFKTISLRIIKEQELIIGPVAWAEAGKVAGLHINNENHEDISLDGNEKEILDTLVARYARLFGKASNEVCKEAAGDLLARLSGDEIPTSLK